MPGGRKPGILQHALKITGLVLSQTKRWGVNPKAKGFKNISSQYQFLHQHHNCHTWKLGLKKVLSMPYLGYIIIIIFFFFLMHRSSTRAFHAQELPGTGLPGTISSHAKLQTRVSPGPIFVTSQSNQEAHRETHPTCSS